MKKYLFRSICKGIFGLCAVVIFWGSCSIEALDPPPSLYDGLTSEQKSLYDQLSQGNRQKLEDFHRSAVSALHPNSSRITRAQARFSKFLTDAKRFQEDITNPPEDRIRIECIMGLAFFNDGSIAVCNQNLKLLLNFGKSSLNGKFQYLHFNSCKDNTKIKTHFLNFFPNFYNKWTIKKKGAPGARGQTDVQLPLLVQVAGQPPYARANGNLSTGQSTNDRQSPLPLKKRSINSQSSLVDSSLPAPVDNQTPTTKARSSSTDAATSKSACSITNLCIPIYLNVNFRTDKNGQMTVLNTTLNPTLPPQYSALRLQLSEYFKKVDPTI